ncbi:unnamed protein product [Linum tenue]|uniref:RNase H type-1 domain-containing protein n=1 Tax=Linum tenue TaxID=586396 RepID=A0AAV0HIL3_9ROSI|nr:unnamed protein product [Linum tenue]
MGNAADDGVLRSHDDRLIKAFTRNLSEGSITRVDLSGVEYGLRLAWELGIRQLKVQTDSIDATKLIESADDKYPPAALINGIRNWVVEIAHIFREGNVVADYLASLGHGLPVGDHSIEFTCPMLNYWLYFDVIGVQTPRLVNNI